MMNLRACLQVLDIVGQSVKPDIGCYHALTFGQEGTVTIARVTWCQAAPDINARYALRRNRPRFHPNPLTDL